MIKLQIFYELIPFCQPPGEITLLQVDRKNVQIKGKNIMRNDLNIIIYKLLKFQNKVSF